MTREARDVALLAAALLVCLAASWGFMAFFSRVDLDAPGAESE